MEDKKLESLAYRLVDLDSLRSLFAHLNYNFADEPANKDAWTDDERNIIQEARVIAKKDDYKVYYLQTNTDSQKYWKGISAKIIKENHGMCLICSHNPSGFKWVFSSLSKDFSKSFNETRHIPIDIRPETGAPKTFVDFLEKIRVSTEDSTTTILAKMSNAFDSFAIQIHDELTVNVFEALKTLSEGISYDQSNNQSLSNETLEEIREPIFILLYRIIFILYAEDRGIFPIEDKIYQDEFSLKWIKEEWILKSADPKKLAEYQVQKRLKHLFRLIEVGSEELDYKKEDFFMHSYYGRIFDRKINHELEEWNIPNFNLLEAISLVTRNRDKNGNYYFLDYSALETRHLGSIYEHLLEFHLHVKNKKIEELPNPNDRKSSGSYYTPQYVVDYIVQNTIEPLIKKIQDETDDKLEQVEKILSLNILDPAMGSGHFLIGVVNYVAKRICEIENADFTETQLNERKRDVARKCIYGVDINPLAVDLAKVSLWLETLSSDRPLSFLDAHLKCGNSLLGSQIEVIFDKQTTLMETQKGREKFRKTIEDFIMFENLEDDSANAVKTKTEKYQNIQSKGSIYYNVKSLLDCKIAESFGVKIPVISDFKSKISENSMDFFTNDSWQTIQQLSSKHRFFHWDLEFPDIFYDKDIKMDSCSGFDCIIGNPPYVKEYSEKEIFEAVKKSKSRVTKYYEGKMDLWYLFCCLSVDLIKKDGKIGLIATNNWATASGASILRNKILEETKIIKFVNFGDFPIFDKVGQQTMVVILQKTSEGKKFITPYSEVVDKSISQEDLKSFLFDNKKSEKIISYDCTVERIQDKKIYFLNSNTHVLKNKIKQKANFYLDKSEIAQGIVSPQDNIIKNHLNILDKDVKLGDGIFVISNEEKKELKFSSEELKLIKPLYSTKELMRYYCNNVNSTWMIYMNTSSIKTMLKFPRIKKHLDRFRKIITSDFKPYGLHRARNENFFVGEKILSLRKTPIPFFTYTTFPTYVLQTYNVIKTDRINLKYLTALFNSKLAHFWFSQEKKQGNNLQIDKEPLMSFPITLSSQKDLEIIISYVDSILKLSSSNITLEQDHELKILQEKIDKKIYEIYCLENNDISLIEK